MMQVLTASFQQMTQITKSLVIMQEAIITICNPKENKDKRKEEMKKLAEKINENKNELLST